MLKQVLCKSNRGVLSTFSCLQLVDYGGDVRQPMDYYGAPIDTYGLMSDGFRGSYNINHYIGWFFVPSVRHLEIRLPDITLLKKTHPDELNLRHLRTLILVGSTISEADVFFLLTRASSLRNLHLELTYRRHNRPTLENRKILAQALASVSDTVENFSMMIECFSCCTTCDQVYQDRDRKDEFWEPIRDVLKKFTRLETLELPLPVLFGPDPNKADAAIILPRTLIKLCLRNDMREPAEFEQWSEARIMDYVCTFVTKGDWRSSTPFFKNILLRMWRFETDDELDDELHEQQEDRSYSRWFSTSKSEGIALEQDWLDYPVSTGTLDPKCQCRNSGCSLLLSL